jgi:predicted alpha/beta hydrolase
VPRRFYRHFARYLADEGARAVLTYDYRGMDKPLGQIAARRMKMAQWATHDLPAAVEFLKARFPGCDLRGVGHSFGGQALGLSGASSSFTRYMTIAAGSGYLGHTREHARLSRAMNQIGRPLALALGYLPKWAGFGEPIPYGAFNQWRKWCNSPDYFMSDRDVPQTALFKRVRIPMMAVGFADDPWATRQSVEALASWYCDAQIRLHWFAEQDLSQPVGHMGFFRSTHRETLWPQLADWLLQN